MESSENTIVKHGRDLFWVSSERTVCGQNFLILFSPQWWPIMLSATLKLLVHEVLDFFRRVENNLLALGAERRCALRLDRVADRLGAMGAKINDLRARMREGPADEAVDPDFGLRDSLRGLKEDIRAIRCQLGGLHSSRLSARLQRAFARLHKTAEETYASADKLQWEIDEHDSTL